MSRIIRILSLSIFSLLALRAYAGVDGTYSVDVEAFKTSMLAMPEFANMPEEQKTMAMAMFEGMAITMTFEDGSFSGEAKMMGESHTGKGTYTVEGDTVTMTTTEEDGVTKEEPQVQKAKIDGDRLLLQDEQMPFAIAMVKTK